MPINFSLNLPLISHCFLRTLSPEEQTETVFPARHTTVYLHRGNAKAKSVKSLSSAGCLPQETCFLFVFPLSVERTLRCVLQQKKKNERRRILSKSKSNLHRGADNVELRGVLTWKRKTHAPCFSDFPAHRRRLFYIRTRRGMSKVIAYFSGAFLPTSLSSHSHILRFARLRSPSMSNLPAREEKKQKKR